MVINIVSAEKVAQRLEQEGSSLELMSDLRSYTEELLFKKGHRLEREDWKLLLDKHINSVSVYQTKELMEILYELMPLRYKYSQQTLSYEAIEEQLRHLEFVNRHSLKRRYLICLEDLIREDGIILFEYGEVLLLSKWKKHVDFLKAS